MNILILSESVWELGPVYDLHLLAEKLAFFGHKVVAVDPGIDSHSVRKTTTRIKKISRTSSGKSIKLFSPLYSKVSILSFYKKIKIFKNLERFFYTKRLIDEILHKERIDIVLDYSVARIAPQALSVCKKNNVPFVHRNVDMQHKLWPTKINQFFVMHLESFIYRSSNRLLALTPSYAEYLVSLGAKRNLIELLYFPLDISIFKPSIINAHNKNLLFMGTLYPFGGVRELILASVSFFKKYPAFTLTILGDGPIRGEIEEMVNELNLEKKVKVLGFKDFKLMPFYINNSYICINAFPINSFTEKIFSAKIIQYISCGKPTVSTNLIGISSLLPEFESGVIYATSFRQIFNKVEAIHLDKKLYSSLSKNGREYALKNHSLTIIARKLENILKRQLWLAK